MVGRLEKLKELEEMLYESMQNAGPKEFASLARQYRETLKDIEEIEGGDSDGDEIAELLESRGADGKAGAVRPDRA